MPNSVAAVASEQTMPTSFSDDVWPRGAQFAFYVLLGLVDGLASALLGIGGGVLVVPVLTSFLGVPMRRAVGISIVTVFGVVCVGVVAEALATTNIQWLPVIVLAVGAQIGVRIGGRISRDVSGKTLRWAFVALLVLTTLKLAQILPGDTSFGLFTQDEILSAWSLTVLALGVLTGVISVLLGIGGGVVVVPGLLFLIDGLGFQAARATSLAMILPTSLAGAIVHVRQRNVPWRPVTLLVVPGFFGAVAGVVLANVMSGDVLRQYVFPVFLAIMAVRLATTSRKS